VSWRSLTKRAGSGAGSASQCYGSADPDPHQNFTDPEHCFKLPCFLQTLQKQNILCEIPTLHLQYILYIDSRHASRLHSFPGMRQPYFYSQTVSKEFSSLLENLLRLHSSFTLYFPLLLYFPFSFISPPPLIFPSPLFSFFFNFPSALFPVLLSPIFVNNPYPFSFAISLFLPFFFYFYLFVLFFLLFTFFSFSLYPFFALLSSLSYFLSPFISLRFNFPLIPYFPPFFIFPSLYVTSYCTFSSSYIFPSSLFSPSSSFPFSPFYFSP